MRSQQNGVVERFTRYLNGRMGKTVLENLDEGESFILQTSEHILRVTKRKAKQLSRLLILISSISNEDSLS